jgi:UDP-3-O-[3-hydroxymyristoyl] glucosamine N-acyltransferase
MNEEVSRFRLAELSERFGLDLRGDANQEIVGVGTLANAGPGEISFLSNRAYREQLGATRAGAVILRPADADHCPVNCLLSDEPYISYARIAALFDHKSTAPPGIHPSAAIDETASIGGQVHIGANVTIGANTEIGRGCSIGAGSVVSAGCRVGDGSRLVANVTLVDGVIVGKRVIIHPGAVVGADGFGLAYAQGHWEKIPQLGSVRIGDDCEIGANTTIDRGAIEDTVLGEDVRIDNLVQVAHNVVIGAHTAIAGCSAIAGSSRIGRNCQLGGRASVLGHLEIADGVTIGANSLVDRDVTEPGSTWDGNIPSLPVREWKRVVSHLRKLDTIVKRIRALEKQKGIPGRNE